MATSPNKSSDASMATKDAMFLFDLFRESPTPILVSLALPSSSQSFDDDRSNFIGSKWCPMFALLPFCSWLAWNSCFFRF